MIVTLRTASLDDLDIIHAIRRDAILGVPPETGLRDRQTWADRRSPAFFADRVAAGRVVMASSAGDDIGGGAVPRRGSRDSMCVHHGAAKASVGGSWLNWKRRS